MCESQNLTPGQNGAQIPPVPAFITLKEAREALERDMVQRALLKHCGNISHAAAELGISRPTFYELMQKLGIKRPGPT